MSHFVSESAGTPCKCGERSTHKVGEEIPHDDPSMLWCRLSDQLDAAQHAYNMDAMACEEWDRPSPLLLARVNELKAQLAALTPDHFPRHNFTTYVCCTCFTALLGPTTGCPL